MFEKSLQDLVKGIRAHKRDPAAFVSTSIAECKKELRDVDPFVKAQAVRKLTYLQMLGYDVSWASFAIVETMSQPRFAHKRIGYLAACQCFCETTDVVLLTTNLLKKEFQSTSQYEVGLAVNCLANICTKDLGRDLLQDCTLLMAHSKPYVRKKATSAMFKLFVRYPQGLRLTFEKLKARLDDAEPAVASCAVNVVCELANKNPNNYLAMAPQFFRLLTTSSNNWMLIKVVKLMGALVPREPRLARKLLEPLATVVQNTQAKSLQYECIHTLTLALPFTKKADGSDSRNAPGVVRLCVDHLRQFVDDPDQNLKYLGLVGFVELMKSHPRAVVEHRELVLLCLADDDVTIRTRALELLTGMVTRKTLEDLVLKLLAHVKEADGSYRDELVSRIVLVCSRDKYAYLSDFVWYLNVLVQLCRLRGAQKNGALLASQLVDITMRVRPVRAYAARDALRLLLDERLEKGQGLNAVGDVLAAAAWVAGEFCAHLLEEDDESESDEEDDDCLPPFPDEHPRLTLVDVLTRPATTRLPAAVQAVYLQNALKVIVVLASDASDELQGALDLISERLDVFLRSGHVEVQERASQLKSLLTTLGALQPGVNAQNCRHASAQLKACVAERLVPVNPKAQARVPRPPDLEREPSQTLQAFLDQPDPKHSTVSFVEANDVGDWAEEEPDAFAETGGFYDIRGSDDESDGGTKKKKKKKKKKKDKKDKKKKSSSGRLNPDHADPFYIRGGAVDPSSMDVSSVPVVRISKKELSKDKNKKKKSRKVGRADVYIEDDSDGDAKKKKSKSKKKVEEGDPDGLDLAQIDLTAPLRADEIMPQHQHRVVASPAPAEPVKAKKASSKKPKKKEKKSKKPKAAPEEDLLGFGASAPPPPSTSGGDVFDLLGGGDSPARAPPPPTNVRRPASRFHRDADDDYLHIQAF